MITRAQDRGGGGGEGGKDYEDRPNSDWSHS